jgi:hypothetical protein
MPAVLTHHLFGKAVISQLGGGVFPTRDEREAFLLGNQGPDPFFYALLTPSLKEVKAFGSTLHSERIDASLAAMRKYVRSLDANQEKVADAYLCGYICHFTLDSIEHPLVFAQQNAITNAGVKGLDDSAGSFVHGQIETDLDSMMLYRSSGKTVRDFVITRQVLRANKAVLFLLDDLYANVSWYVYGLPLPDDAFSRSVKDMRISVRLMQSRGGTKRTLLGYVERLVRPHSLVQAMSHRTDVGEQSEFNNSEHQSWTNPFTNEDSDASFSDLFDSAVQVALENLRLHAEGAATALITAGLDFSGKPQQRL